MTFELPFYPGAVYVVLLRLIRKTKHIRRFPAIPPKSSEMWIIKQDKEEEYRNAELA